MRASTYRIRQIGRALKEGRMWIGGKCSGGARWPDEPHFWIINDPSTQTVWHVPVDERPSWVKYLQETGR